MTTTVPLGEIVDFYSGGTPSKARPEFWTGSVPWFSAKDIKNPLLIDSKDHVSEEAFSETSLRRLPAGTVVLVVRGMILNHTVPISRLGVEAAVNQDLKALLPKVDVDTAYLAAMLRAQHSALLSRVTTAAHGTKKLETRVLAETPVPLPPVSEQRRIAAILDQADAIRTKRRQVLAHLDALVRSTFHDLFGDSTGEGWERVPLGQVVGRIDNGTSPNCESRPAESDEWGVLKLGAVTYGVFRPGENKAYRGPVGRMERNEVRPGDVLMTRKNTRELVGAVAVVEDVRPRLLLPDLIFRLQLDRARVDARYFQAMMMSERVRAVVRGLSSGSAASMPNISKARLMTLAIDLPPLYLQREFSGRLAAIDAQRGAVERAVTADEEFFLSLQSRAFRGDL